MTTNAASAFINVGERTNVTGSAKFRKLIKENDLTAALAVARDQAIAEYQRTLFGQLTEAQRKVDGLVHDVERIQRKIDAQYLTAPIAGTVQQLAIHTVGGIVTPAQNLLVVVPGEGRLEIEAMILNRDVGFVEPGQNAEIKVDTFNFTRYGLLHGKVLSVSHDAVVRDKHVPAATEKASGADSTSSDRISHS